MRIVLVGAGNLATNLGKALVGAGHSVVQVYSRTMESARLLADAICSEPINDIADIVTDADAYILSVKDGALKAVADGLFNRNISGIVMHTAGSIPMDVLNGFGRNGVFYPMQTFSKNKAVDFKKIPLFVEASDAETLEVIRALAESVSGKVYELSSEKRKYLHLSAVFACNFVNHCYALSEKLLADNGIPFDVMLSLTDETADKIHSLSPKEAQTGPAVRYDKNVIAMQAGLLDSYPQIKEIYQLMSKSIHELR